MIRIAVLGAGRIGRIHAGNVAASPNAKLVVVAGADIGASSPPCLHAAWVSRLDGRRVVAPALDRASETPWSSHP